MPPKKKGNKQDEDDPTQNIAKFYRKKCDANGILNHSKAFKDKVESVCDEGEPLEKVVPFFKDFLIIIYRYIYGMSLAQFMYELFLTL